MLKLLKLSGSKEAMVRKRGRGTDWLRDELSAMVIIFFIVFINSFFIAQGLIIGRDPSFSSKQNKSFYFPKYRPEIFYDNKVLPEDIEVDVFVFKEQLQRLFYILEGGHRPLFITVTPCSASVEWRLSYHVFPDVAGSYSTDPYYNHVLRPRHVSPSSPTAVYSGAERRSYSNPRAPPGLYTLELKATVAEATVKIFATTRPITQSSYHPPLPTDPRVEIVKVKRNRVLISWKASTSSRTLEYCVAANTRDNYRSLCSVTSDLYGDIPATPPSASGFGFQWEKSSKKTLVTKVTNLRKNLETKDDIIFTCVGRKTWHMFRGLQRGRKYYFDVFALDVQTNASTAYVGATASVKNAAPPSKLKDDALVTLSLDNSNGFAITTKYQVGKSSGPALLFVQSCTGPGPITLAISRNNGETILSEEIMDMKTLEIPHASNMTYLLTLRSSSRNVRKVRVWVSGKKHAFPFPVLPPDKNVKVFDTLITCDSITIGWRASSDEKVKYCIFRRTAKDELMRQMLAEPQNFCQTPPGGSTDRKMVVCRRYHRFSKRRFNNVIMQRVRGLDSNTTYLFEVQVTKSKGKMLPYEQVWATTSKTCSAAKTKR